MRDLTCTQAIKSCFALMPDAGGRHLDYSLLQLLDDDIDGSNGMPSNPDIREETYSEQ